MIASLEVTRHRSDLLTKAPNSSEAKRVVHRFPKDNVNLRRKLPKSRGIHNQISFFSDAAWQRGKGKQRGKGDSVNNGEEENRGHRKLLLARTAIEKRRIVSGIPAVLIGQANRADKAGRKTACDSLHCIPCVSWRGGCREMHETQFTRPLIRRSMSVAKIAPPLPRNPGPLPQKGRNLRGFLRFERPIG
jgi:hypothetical protein